MSFAKIALCVSTMCCAVGGLGALMFSQDPEAGRVVAAMMLALIAVVQPVLILPDP